MRTFSHEGDTQYGHPVESQSTWDWLRGGATLSSDEACESRWSEGVTSSSFGFGATAREESAIEARLQGGAQEK